MDQHSFIVIFHIFRLLHIQGLYTIKVLLVLNSKGILTTLRAKFYKYNNRAVNETLSKLHLLDLI